MDENDIREIDEAWRYCIIEKHRAKSVVKRLRELENYLGITSSVTIHEYRIFNLGMHYQLLKIYTRD